MKTTDDRNIKIEKLDWNRALQLIKKIKPELSLLLKQISINTDDLFFYRASYAFGDKIIGDKQTFLSLENGGSIALVDKRIPEEISLDLCYDQERENPLGLVLSKTSELYMGAEALDYSSKLLRTGDFFGVPKALDSENPDRSSILNFNLNAGGRSLFMLPKISDNILYLKACQSLKLSIPSPQKTDEHWQIFVALATQLKSNWECEILYFSRKFIQALRLKEFSELSLYFYKTHAASYNAWHSMANIWQKELESINHKKLLAKYNQNLFNIIKYIFMSSANSEIGFAPLLDNDQAPVGEIQDFYKYAYGLENPIVMGVQKFNYKNNDELPIYISLNQRNTLLENINSSGKHTNISALSDIIYLNNSLREDILNDNVNSNNSLKNLIELTKITYFHNSPSNNTMVRSSKFIPLEDERFMQCGQTFPQRATFLNGCIRISKA